MAKQQWEISDWNGQENDGMVHIRQAELAEYDEDEQGQLVTDSRRVVDTHQFRKAHHIPKSGPGRGEAISAMQRELANLRSGGNAGGAQGGGKPEEVEAIETELNQ